MFKSKRAQERFLSVWNVLIWIILASVIVISIAMFNNYSTDARVSEAKILNQKIIDCLVNDEGTLIEKLDKDFSIYKACSIKEDLFEEDLALGARIQLFEAGKKEPDLTLYFGNTELTFLCDITSEAKPKNCFSDTIFANSKEEDIIYQINIQTSSNHEGQILA
jgi:hypothetical protein